MILASTLNSGIRTAVVAALAVLIVSGANPAQAKLAITEVMAHDTSNGLVQGSDFWELTNFGTNAIDLAGYAFADNASARFALPGGLSIAPQQSIVFFRTNAGAMRTEAEFRHWWGLAEATAIVLAYERPGLSQFGDSLRLYDAEGNLVDRIDFGHSPEGVSLTYDPATGEYGVPTVADHCGAVARSETRSVGSPGTTCGPVPLAMVGQPTNVVLAAGADAAFVVKLNGFPRPACQWFFEGTPLTAATIPVLLISNAHPDQAGTYRVWADNGLEIILSTPATLTVLTNPRAPAFEVSPTNTTVYPGDTARFHAVVSGWPVPALQWTAKGTALPGETNRNLSISNCATDMSGWIYCLKASNHLGEASACAPLHVISSNSAQLRITEIMARQPPLHKDWFELTNYDTNDINLAGFRYGQRFSLEDARVITQAVVLKPGESVIFADNLTANEFFAWWGADNLPADLQVITWTGFGFSPAGGEMLFVWDPFTQDPARAVDQVFTDAFLPATSRYYEKTAECGLLGCISVTGERGAFPATNGGEIGSPGYDRAPDLQIFSVVKETPGVTIKGRGVAGQSYVLLMSDTLPVLSWQAVRTNTAEGAFVSFRHEPEPGRSVFYRLQEEPTP